MDQGETRPAGRVARLKPDPVEAADRVAFRDDILRLVGALAAAGISATEDVVYAAWKQHSDWHAAGWLILYDGEEELRRALLPHLDVED